MARFQLTAAMSIGSNRYKAGTTLADSQANAVGSDKVWTGMSASTIHPNMVPLDGAATTMKNASPYANVSARQPDGVSSIDA